MKTFYALLLFTLLNTSVYSQDEQFICYELFNSSSVFTTLSTEAIALASECVWEASQMNGNQVTLTGTLALSGDTWTYSASPNDKLIVQLPNNIKLEFKWIKFYGYIEGTWDSFTKSHDIDLYANLQGTLDFHIVSKTYPDEQKKIHWHRNINGSVIYYNENTNVNLIHTGVSSSSVDNGFAESEYQEQCSGSTSSSVMNASINDQYYSHIIHNSNTKQFVQNKEMLSNSSATINNNTYQFLNAHLRWAAGTQFRDSAQAGIYNEAIDGNYWIAEGKMNKNGQHLGDVVFQQHASLPTYGPSLVLKTVGGQNYLLHPILRRWMTITDVKKIDSSTPLHYELAQNYPNPFNPSTSIKYSIPGEEHVRITIYDMNGKKVTELVNQNQKAGTYEVTWNSKDNLGNSVASGIYVYTIHAGSYFHSNKMLLLK